ncbi:MAG: HAMP domain-containing sensor histidine kinase [Acutalibacteraceae bacterium]|nr:HAMP domain-containing sensor histidine kinase [Acutalibacteraceae bacterium]MEE1281106.1 HAMP domain-containing sensor histidine kinase [Acutalibacteraceae bacterium]
MPYMFIILILIIVVSFLSVKLYLIKKQLRNIAEQMQEQDERAVSLDFVDKDLEAVALNINKKLEQLQMVKIKAVKKEQAMRTSISMISHDMRTPLTSVIGYLQLAEKSCTDEETLQDIHIALDRAKCSNKLVDDFYELSLIDSEQYVPVIEKVNICEVVCEEILANYLAFENKGILPLFEQADSKIIVWADHNLLARVVQNLISNGIKYSTGEMNFVITQEKSVTLAISNSVFKPVDVEKIFDKFYRADDSRNGDGAGLGLYICKKLVEEMNGKIYAINENDMLTIKIEFDHAL